MAKLFSHSKIDQFGNCPRQYKFNHIEKATVEKPVSVEMFLGSTVHRALEQLYRNKVNGRIQPEEEMLGDYHKAWEGPHRDNIKVTRESSGIDDFIRIGDKALKEYYKMHYPFDEGEILGLEYNVNFPLDSSGRFTIRAKLDKLVRREDGVVEIIDYKTKSHLPTQPSLDSNLQMGLYQMGINYLWPQFDKIELKQIYLRQGVTMSTVMNEEKLDELRQIIKDRIYEIEQATRDDNFPTRESGLCDFCVYYDLCPAKRHRLALEDDSDEEWDADTGRKLADEYLSLYKEKKTLESNLEAIKDDILKYCEQTDLAKLESGLGSIKVSFSETEGFPSKTEDENSFIRISQLVREAGLYECFKLEPNVLYKDFVAKEKVDPNLLEKLKSFIRKKRTSSVRASLRHDDSNEIDDNH